MSSSPPPLWLLVVTQSVAALGDAVGQRLVRVEFRGSRRRFLWATSVTSSLQVLVFLLVLWGVAKAVHPKDHPRPHHPDQNATAAPAPAPPAHHWYCSDAPGCNPLLQAFVALTAHPALWLNGALGVAYYSAESFLLRHASAQVLLVAATLVAGALVPALESLVLPAAFRRDEAHLSPVRSAIALVLGIVGAMVCVIELPRSWWFPAWTRQRTDAASSTPARGCWTYVKRWWHRRRRSGDVGESVVSGTTRRSLLDTTDEENSGAHTRSRGATATTAHQSSPGLRLSSRSIRESEDWPSAFPTVGAGGRGGAVLSPDEYISPLVFSDVDSDGSFRGSSPKNGAESKHSSRRLWDERGGLDSHHVPLLSGSQRSIQQHQQRHTDRVTTVIQFSNASIAVAFILVALTNAGWFVLQRYVDNKYGLGALGYLAVDQVLLPLYMWPWLTLVTVLGRLRSGTATGGRAAGSSPVAEKPCCQPWTALLSAYESSEDDRALSTWEMIKLTWRETPLLQTFLFRLLINGRAVAYFVLAVGYNLGLVYVELTFVKIAAAWLFTALLVIIAPWYISASKLEQQKAVQPVNVLVKILGTGAIIASLLLVTLK